MSAGPFGGLGPALRRLRADRGLTQAQVAERAGVAPSGRSLRCEAVGFRLVDHLILGSTRR